MLSRENWEVWLPDPAYPLYKEFRLLQLQAYGQDYNDQKGLLDKPYEKEGESVFVATYFAIENKGNGEPTRFCVWTKGVPTLLPKTDLIGFAESDAKSRVAARYRIVETVGNLMEAL